MINNPGAVYKLLVEVAALPVAERKAALVPRLELLWEMAINRSRESQRKFVVDEETGEKVPKMIPNPDTATALRVVEVADAILCDVAEDKGNKFAVLRKFDAAPRKVG
jgi:hypothetical protein